MSRPSNSIKINVDIKGVDGIIARFSKLDQATTTAVRKAIVKSANSIRKAARARVPVNEGVMQKRIRATFSPDKLSAEIAPRSPFAHLVEFGTVQSRAHPFMTPTWESERKKYEDAIKAAVKGAMR